MISELKATLTKLVTGQSPEGMDETPEDEVAKWTLELADSEKFLEKFRTSGKKTVEAYLGQNGILDSKTRLNLFYSNIVTLKALLSANPPKATADRTFADPDDDVGRVAAEMCVRVIQQDLFTPDDTFVSSCKEALQDRLLPGLGEVRLKYNMEEAEDPTQPDTVEENGELTKATKKTDEWCDFVYTHWNDVRWSPCRTRDEMRWKAYRTYLTKEEVTERFGEEVADAIAFTSKGPEYGDKNTSLTPATREARQAEVWEIWDKTAKEVVWYSKGYKSLLDKKPDTLQLPEFWPGEFMMANTTSDALIPKSDYAMTQDLYEEIDALQTRISVLTEAAKCVGVYDQSAKEVARIFSEGLENTLIAVPNWAMFADKGGLKGVIDFFPLKDVVEAIETLGGQLQTRITLLFQVSGMSDIMRGQATSTGVTATEQKLKAQFGSTRIQDRQEEFGVFVQALLNKKAWVIRKFYDPERIVKLSNILNTPDAALVPQAVALLKSEDFGLRVVIQADSLAQVDKESLKKDRAEYMQAVAQFIGQSVPLIQLAPEAFPFTLKLLRFGLAAMPGSDAIEGVIDQFAAQIENTLKQKQSQPPPPSPEDKKLQLEQQKMQADQQMAAADGQREAQAQQSQQQMDMQKMALEMQQSQQEFQQTMKLQQEEHQLKMAELSAKIQGMERMAQIKEQSAQTQAAISASSAQQTAEIKADSAQQDMELKAEQAENQTGEE